MRRLIAAMLLLPGLAWAQTAATIPQTGRSTGTVPPAGQPVVTKGDLETTFGLYATVEAMRSKLDASRLGQPNGVAALDGAGRITAPMAGDASAVTVTVPGQGARTLADFLRAPYFSGLVEAGDRTHPFWDHYGVPAGRIAVQGNRNGFVALARNNLPANTLSFPTAGTFGCLQDSPGGLCFPLYTEARARGPGVATSELSAFNDTDTPPDAVLPPNRGIGISTVMPIAATISCGGRSNCSIGIDVEPEGSSVPPVRFQTGMYIGRQAVANNGNGIVIDATSDDGPLNPLIVRGRGGNAPIQVQVVNGLLPPATTPGIRMLDSLGTPVAAWNVDGSLVNAGGALTAGGGYVGKSQRVAPASGDTVQLTAATTAAVLDPPAPIAALTLTLPPQPVDGQRVDVVCGQTITTLTVQTLFGQVQRFSPTTSCGPEAGRSYRYAAAGAAWFRSY